MVISKRALRRYIDRAVAREVHRIRYTDGLVEGIKQKLQFAYQKLAGDNSPAGKKATSRIKVILGLFKKPGIKKAAIASAVLAGASAITAGILSAKANSESDRIIKGSAANLEAARRAVESTVEMAEAIQNRNEEMAGRQGELFG